MATLPTVGTQPATAPATTAAAPVPVVNAPVDRNNLIGTPNFRSQRVAPRSLGETAAPAAAPATTQPILGGTTTPAAPSIPSFNAAASTPLQGGFPASPEPFDGTNTLAASKPLTLGSTAPTAPTAPPSIPDMSDPDWQKKQRMILAAN